MCWASSAATRRLSGAHLAPGRGGVEALRVLRVLFGDGHAVHLQKESGAKGQGGVYRVNSMRSLKTSFSLKPFGHFSLKLFFHMHAVSAASGASRKAAGTISRPPNGLRWPPSRPCAACELSCEPCSWLWLLIVRRRQPSEPARAADGARTPCRWLSRRWPARLAGARWCSDSAIFVAAPPRLPSRPAGSRQRL